MRRPGLLTLITITTMMLALLTSVASGHVERSSYWPDPAADRSVSPPAGGGVPKARSLRSALKKSASGRTRVVCKRNSLKKAMRSIRRARRVGYRVRPSTPLRKLSAKQARRLRMINRRLARDCKFRHIQAAVFRSSNNDRIVIMPGEYLEQPSRAKPTDDPKCEKYEEESDKGAGAATYRYQVNCPNDQNLIYIQGRALTNAPVPFPPREDRRGIPDAGPCVRCNLQIEGSGVTAGDVVIDLAKDAKGTKLRGPAEPVKDVGIRADRADGIVIRKITGAHAREHAIYVHEVDGYLLSRFRVFWNGEYGALMFTSDHGLVTGCEGAGHGDSAVYPGAAPDTAEQTKEGRRRVNTVIRRCDIHHNTLGYSGTMGNATRVVHNNFYDNGTAITTDSFYAGGHPGYPQDGAIFENNRIYSNNFNSYAEGSDVEPVVPVPVGVGIMIAGGNGNEIRGNRIWDNWRRGTMLFQVPDAISGSSGTNSTSHRNRYHDNVMGVDLQGKRSPNGVDFWWDGAPAQEDNCWFNNGQVTSDPPAPLLPGSCENTSSGEIYATRAAELLGCAGAIETGSRDPNQCLWFATPPRPSGASSARNAGAEGGEMSELGEAMAGSCRLVGTALGCGAFLDRP